MSVTELTTRLQELMPRVTITDELSARILSAVRSHWARQAGKVRSKRKAEANRVKGYIPAGKGKSRGRPEKKGE